MTVRFSVRNYDTFDYQVVRDYRLNNEKHFISPCFSSLVQYSPVHSIPIFPV